MSASLVILAAGLGARFKDGIKQLTPVGKNGELLIEYSVYDALSVGFDEVIFIIRKEIEQQFKELIGDKISKKTKVTYCYQSVSDLPSGYSAPENRTKPWGTVHAVLSAADFIHRPFLIINADDFYGKTAYKNVFEYITSPDRKSGEQCMSGFVLKNTLSSRGAVTRGICSADTSDNLTSVTETYRTSRHPDGIVRGEQNGIVTDIDDESVASMNMWGCGQDIIPLFRQCFEKFLDNAKNDNTIETAEYALPIAVDELIKSGLISVKVLKTNDRWFGMTYKEDCYDVIDAFSDMIARGEYPEQLFD